MVNRWEPVRKGNRYCAPSCGMGCTWAAYKKAVAASEALCKELGDGWTPDIWENLGWHYKAVRGVVEVYPVIHGTRSISYTCYVQTDPQFIGSGDTARNALLDAGEKFLAIVSALRDSLTEAQSALSEATTMLLETR